MDLKIALSGDLPARCSDALAALCAGTRHGTRGGRVLCVGTGAQLLAVAATEHPSP